jgi:pantoate--beta-alanine ligase
MQIIKSPKDIYNLTQKWRHENQQIGFVPTMGALHEGHLSLCARAREENQKYITSIFVNPTQFAPGEDYEKYFRPFERDCELLRDAGCDALFAPDAAQMYNAENSTTVSVSGLSALWEGLVRPTHFDGVTTVVSKLFHLIPAHHAYFGEKDYQQLKIIQRMTRDLNFPVEIIPVPTVRENDGVAKSSRNAYLNPAERQAAAVLYRALLSAAKLASDGEKNVKVLSGAMSKVCAQEPLFQLDYAAIVDAETLQPLVHLENNPARALIAGYIGKTHLIDNCAIGAKTNNTLPSAPW